MDASLRGIDPSTLKPEELGELVGTAITQVRGEGLSWSSCASTVTGAAVVVAALVVGVIAMVKSKSEAKVRAEYAKKRTEKTDLYNNAAAATRNWQTTIPNDIQWYDNQIRQAYYDIQYYQDAYYRTDDPAQRDSYYRQIQSLQQRIQQYQYQINLLYTQWDRYAADPSLAEADAVAIEVERDQVLADLLVQEGDAVARVPRDRKQAVGLGIGAGLGAAVGGYLLVDGLRDGGCRH
jgi:hypothetical protein